jgi:hypothetical protein
MTIGWNPDQRTRVTDALRKFPYDSDRCAAAARLILPVAREVDEAAGGLMLTGHDGAPFILSKSPKPRSFSHHVLVEADGHRVDALTGEDGHDAGSYLEEFWQYPEFLRVEDVDVHTIDVGIQRDDQGL